LREEPQPARAKKFPEPPAYLSEYAAHEWHRTGRELWQLGLLTTIDEAAFSCYCQSFGRWRMAEERLASEDLVVRGTERSNRVPNPFLKIAAQAARDLIKFGSEFGLTPSARARVAAGMPPASSPSKFGDLLS
jgi:P27 family predicted phage terminase small subunit